MICRYFAERYPMISKPLLVFMTLMSWRNHITNCCPLHECHIENSHIKTMWFIDSISFENINSATVCRITFAVISIAAIVISFRHVVTDCEKFYCSSSLSRNARWNQLVTDTRRIMQKSKSPSVINECDFNLKCSKWLKFSEHRPIIIIFLEGNKSRHKLSFLLCSKTISCFMYNIPFSCHPLWSGQKEQSNLSKSSAQKPQTNKPEALCIWIALQSVDSQPHAIHLPFIVQFTAPIYRS